MVSDDELRKKRGFVGLFAVVCIAGAGGLEFVSASDGFQAALLRVGLLLGAFWLAFPTKNRPAAWANVSWLTVGVLVMLAVLIPRFRYALPVLLIGTAIGWLVRPRRRNK